MSGLILGIINIAIVVAVLVLVGLIIVWFASWMGLAIPEPVKKVYMIIVFLIGLGMIVALIFGVSFGPRFVGDPFQVAGATAGALPATTATHL